MSGQGRLRLSGSVSARHGVYFFRGSEYRYTVVCSLVFYVIPRFFYFLVSLRMMTYDFYGAGGYVPSVRR